MEYQINGLVQERRNAIVNALDPNPVHYLQLWHIFESMNWTMKEFCCEHEQNIMELGVGVGGWGVAFQKHLWVRKSKSS